MDAAVFYAFGALAILFSLMVVFLRNPVTSTLSLVASFFCVSGIFVLLHAAFLGVIQVLIYAGAILVLFLYVLMLLNVRHPEIERPAEKWMRYGGLVGLPALIWILFRILPPPLVAAVNIDESFGGIASVGKLLIGPYALLFELVSLVLLVAILGVVALAKKPEAKS